MGGSQPAESRLSMDFSCSQSGNKMNKPIVHYRKDCVVKVAVGIGAIVTPVDHTNHVEGQHVSNERPCWTSKVLSYDKETGVFETMNTIYQPTE